METVSNIATAASKAIWGEGSTQNTDSNEPVSGSSGNVQAGEPYDKGNVEADVGKGTYLNYSGDKANTFENEKDQYGNPTGVGSTGTSGEAKAVEESREAGYNTMADAMADAEGKDKHGNPIAVAGSTSSNTDTLPGRSTGALASATGAGATTDTTTKNTADDTSSSKPTTGLGDNNPSTTIPAPSKDSTTSPNAPPTANTDAPSDAQPTAPPSETKNDSDTAKGNSEDVKDDEGNKKEDIVPGIHEVKKTADHAPKFDTFETKTGPHIENPKDDGRVGPGVAKGDIDEALLRDDNKGAEDDSEGSGSQSAKKELKQEQNVQEQDHATEKQHSSEDADGDGKHKVGLMDKIKAKLHHNKD